jgi:photosystem II stability/assembly factor-like uncharacterized protein
MRRHLLRFGVALAMTCLAVLLLSGLASALSTGDGGWQWQNALPQGNDYTGGWFRDVAHGWLISDGDIFHTSNGGFTLTLQAYHRVLFRAITFVDAKHGWAVGQPVKAHTMAIIYRTTNGGRTWVRVRLRLFGGINAVSFANQKVGWAVSGNAVLHTVDGGLHWAIRAMRKRDRFNCVQALSTRRAWISGAADTLLRTVNGGATWKRFHTGTGTGRNLTGMRFTSPTIGWVSGGGVIVQTTDGSLHWTSQISIASSGVIGLTFADSQNGWATPWGGAVYHTSDGGAHWAQQTTAPRSAWGFALTPSDAVVGGLYNTGLSGTSDGGATWQSSTRAADDYYGTLNGLQFINAATGWAVGSGGEILATTDGGTTWAAQASSTTEDLSGVHFVDATDGWAVGDQGVIVHTTDGGATWTAQTSGTSYDLTGLTFTDAQNGWATGQTFTEYDNYSSGVILHTTDGGQDWTTQYASTLDVSTASDGTAFSAVAFADAQHGWAVGETQGSDSSWNDTVIMHTTDGGATWTQQLDFSPPLASNIDDATLSSIACTDAEHAVAVGYDENRAEIWRTTNGGQTWTRVGRKLWPLYSPVNLSDVVFADATHGWAVGDGTVIKTSDGGVAWTKQAVGPTNGLNAVSFVSRKHGWVAGAGADILTTTTGGNAP